MGMALRMCVYRDGRPVMDGRAHDLLFELAEVLDEYAERAGAIPLTTFYDHSALEAEFDDGSDDPDDVAWFSSADGLRTVSALLDYLREHPDAPLNDENGDDPGWHAVVEELDYCETALRAAADESLPFHLSVVV
jgi:hypothetical protein